MITLTSDATLHPLVLPARADAADAGEFRELARVRNLVYRELTGRHDQDLAPEALLPLLRSRVERITQAWAVRLHGRIIGRAVIDIPLEQGSGTAIVTIELLREAWGQGIGSAVLPTSTLSPVRTGERCCRTGASSRHPTARASLRPPGRAASPTTMWHAS